MIEHLEISGVHTTVTPELQKYVNKKIGKLDRFIPRYARESAHFEVHLKESKAKDKKQCTCEVKLHMPGESFTIKESTINMFAAVDIVEAKLKNHIKKYKEKHGVGRLHKRVLTKLRRQI
ncbi:MAG: ribosome-associated translation inhibitor RaiA [Patescibacteria group bacterium]